MTDICEKPAEWPISEAFRSILQEAVKERAGACIVSFRGPSYGPEAGGFHPVEVMIGASGDIQYVTDFAYAGQCLDAELVKELDFDFANGAFENLGHEYPISAGQDIFRTWMKNFVSFHAFGVYEVTVEDA